MLSTEGLLSGSRQVLETETFLKTMRIFFCFTLKLFLFLTLARSIWPTPLVFPKMYLLEKGWNPGFLWLNIIIRHIFPENFIKILQVAQKKWRFYLPILTTFIDFLIFWHFLVTKKLMTPAYNRWCQHFLLPSNSK